MGPLIEYMNKLVVFMVAGAIVIAYTLDKILPPSLAAPAAVMLALGAAYYMDDNITQQFNTDVEEILKPNDVTMQLLVLLVVGSLAVTAGVAAIMGSVLGAVAGLFLIWYTLQRAVG